MTQRIARTDRHGERTSKLLTVVDPPPPSQGWRTLRDTFCGGAAATGREPRAPPVPCGSESILGAVFWNPRHARELVCAPWRLLPAASRQAAITGAWQRMRIAGLLYCFSHF